MSPEAMRSMVERYIDAYNRKDVAAMLALVHPQVKFQNIAGGEVNASTHGIAELEALARQSLALFSERRQTLQTFALQGPVAMVTVAFHAVVAADLPAQGLKQGDVMDLAGRSEFEFHDGLISKITDIS